MSLLITPRYISTSAKRDYFAGDNEIHNVLFYNDM